jgi:environmental stress-induced protein Ves
MTEVGRPSIERIPLSVRVIDASQHRSMPWKNGFGTTTEIAIDPPGGDLGSRFRWRLSIAAVQSSGPFSAFPGYERTIMLIDGGGMDLMVGNDAPRRIDRAFEPFIFSGEAPVDCRLIEGPIRDFNLMVDRSRLQSRMQVWREISVTRSIDLASADHILHCFEGAVDLALTPADWSRTLCANETAVFRQDESRGAGLQVTPATGVPSTIAVIALNKRSKD